MEITSLKPDAINLEQFLKKNNQYQIPLYQRTYDWKEAEVKTLLQDLYNAGANKNSYYYLGNILIKKEKETTNDPEFDTFKVIDGQQRLTTLHLIAKAMIVFLETSENTKIKQNKKNHINKLEEFFLLELENNSTESKPDKLKLQIDSADQFLRQLFLLKPKKELEDFLKKYKNSSYVVAYRTIEKFFKENFEEYENFSIFKKAFKKTYFIVIQIIDKKINENEMFKSLNAKGVSLDLFDLLRNEIYFNVETENSQFTKKEKEEIFNFFNLEVYEFFLEQKTFNNKNFKKKIFLECFLNCMVSDLVGSKKEKDLIIIDKIAKERFKDKESIIKFLKDFKNMFRIYRWAINNIENILLKQPEKQEENDFRFFNIYYKNFNTYFTVLNKFIKYFIDQEADNTKILHFTNQIEFEEELTRFLKTIDSYILLRWLNGTSNGDNRTIQQLAKNITTDNYHQQFYDDLMKKNKDKLPLEIEYKKIESFLFNNKEIYEKEKDNWNLKYFFSFIENFSFSKENSKKISLKKLNNKKELQIDHIIPDELNDFNQKDKKIQKYIAYLQEWEIKEDSFLQIKNKLANLTIITSPDNIKAVDDIAKKFNYYQEEGLLINSYFDNQLIWDEDAWRERNNFYVKEFFKHWGAFDKNK